MNKLKKDYNIFFIIIIFLIVIDQVLKFIAIKNNNLILIDGVLKFNILENTKGTYGVNNNSSIMYVLTNFIVIVIAFKFFMSQNQFVDKKSKIFLTLIIAGGISNCTDRIFRGYVIEFLDFTDLINFPVFNLADFYILIGWICMVAVFSAFSVKELRNRKHT